MFRKLAAILLLCLFVFNTIGYRLLVTVAIDKADESLEQSLDNKTYDDGDIFLVKLAMSLPYQTTRSVNYDRVDGEVNVNGEIYRYVQRKVDNDTLYLQCIRHTEKTAIQQKANDYFGKTADVAANSANSKKGANNHTITIKYSVSDFLTADFDWKPLQFNTVVCYSNKTGDNIGLNCIEPLIQPPQA